jgi:hypothetical protein
VLPIIAEDSSFASVTGRRIRDVHTVPDDDVTFTTLYFRKQKNNDNGQTLTYRHCSDLHWMCPTQASLNIFWQAWHLGLPPNSPTVV